MFLGLERLRQRPIAHYYNPLRYNDSMETAIVQTKTRNKLLPGFLHSCKLHRHGVEIHRNVLLDPLFLSPVQLEVESDHLAKLFTAQGL